MHKEKWLSQKLREPLALAPWFMYSFEDCGRPDVPDIYAIRTCGRTCWIELKVVPTIWCQVPFRRGQPQWLEDHAERGGRSWVLILVDSVDELWLLDGGHARGMSKVKLGLFRPTVIIPIKSLGLGKALRELAKRL